MLLAALAVFVVNLGLLFLQARAFKRSPRLGMLINFDAGIRYAFRLFYWVIPCALVLVSPAAPALKLLAVIATEMTYLVYGTVLVDLFRIGRLQALLDAGKVDAAQAAARRIARNVARRSDPVVSARLTAATAACLNDYGQAALANELLSAHENVPMTRAHQWRLRLELAAYRIAIGRFESARCALEGCTGAPPLAGFDVEKACVLARLDAADGRPEQALAAAESRDGLRWDVVRAHAFAALDRGGDAREALENVHARGGERSVRQIALGKGPAAPLAAQLIDAKGSPYRR